MSALLDAVGQTNGAYVLFGCHTWLLALPAIDIAGLISAESYQVAQQLPNGPLLANRAGVLTVGFDVGMLLGADQPAVGPGVLVPWTFGHGPDHLLLRCGQQLLATSLTGLLPLPKNCFRQRSAALAGAFATPPAYQQTFGPYGLCLHPKRLWSKAELDEAIALAPAPTSAVEQVGPNTMPEQVVG